MAPPPAPRRWRRRLLYLVLALLAAVLLLLGLFYVSTDWGAAFGEQAEGERLARMQRSPRYREGAFHNVAPRLPLGFVKGLGIMWEFFVGGDPDREPADPLPVLDPRRALAAPSTSGLRITWLGHSTMLIEIDGLRLLTDPVWGPRASPSSIMGPARFHAPPLALADVGALDAVLISHDHYDHLDMPTVRQLVARRVPFLVPLGVGAHLESWGVDPALITEHDWWDETRLGPEAAPVRLVSTPSQHFSGRFLTDTGATLWTSWSLVGPKHRVFFSGDTGLAPELPEIGARFGPFDVAMFEVGAWDERWGDIHLGPAGALTAMAQVRATRLLPIHWGTFDLGLHAWRQPAELLWTLAPGQGISLITPRLGGTVELGAGAPLPAPDPWWRELPVPTP